MDNKEYDTTGDELTDVKAHCLDALEEVRKAIDIWGNTHYICVDEACADLYDVQDTLVKIAGHCVEAFEKWEKENMKGKVND